MPRFPISPSLLLICLAWGRAAVAADAPSEWVVPAPNLAKYTYFSNLADGAKIETPYLLKFGLTGFGVAPIVKPVKGAGHHHLLVNRELPLDFTKPLPFNDQYIHFGQGQMETVLTLAPGTYSLRLVMADEKHIPNFVYGKPTTVTVTRKTHTDPRSLVTQRVEILAPAAGATVRGTFRVALHASGLNISSLALPAPGTGRFRLRVKAEAGREELVDLTNGHTEVWLHPPAGGYTARAEFMDNTASEKVLFTSEPVAFRVQN